MHLVSLSETKCKHLGPSSLRARRKRLFPAADTWYNSKRMTLIGTSPTTASAPSAAWRAYLWTWRFS